MGKLRNFFMLFRDVFCQVPRIRQSVIAMGVQAERLSPTSPDGFLHHNFYKINSLEVPCENY